MSVSYELLERQLRELLADEPDLTANAANFAAFVYHELPDVNWAGFYRLDTGGHLILGPFCGRPACTRIQMGRGVCGTAAAAQQTVLVDDVARFEDHIACDTASRSEIVVPIIAGERLLGVFDVDSPLVARFSFEDRDGIERLVRAFCDKVHPNEVQ